MTYPWTSATALLPPPPVSAVQGVVCFRNTLELWLWGAPWAASLLRDLKVACTFEQIKPLIGHAITLPLRAVSWQWCGFKFNQFHGNPVPFAFLLFSILSPCPSCLASPLPAPTPDHLFSCRFLRFTCSVQVSTMAWHKSSLSQKIAR